MLIEGVDQRITHERAEELITRYGDRPEVRMVVDPVLVTPYYGNVSRAAEAGREAVERYRDLPELQHQLAAQLAVTLWFSGDLTGARALAEPLVSTPGSLTTTVWARGVLALIAIEQDEPRLAERYARETAQAVTQAGADTAPEFAGVRAMLADALRVNGKLTEARVEIDYACALEEQRPGSIGHAFALLLDAQLALAERRRARGRASARRAREIFNQFPDVGATVTARLEAVEGALAGSADTASLGSMPSPAELRVLELLATGMKRSQIARELYVSDATVKSHLRRLFRRLGVNTRAEAINAARERRLLPSLESLPEPEEALSVRGGRG